VEKSEKEILELKEEIEKKRSSCMDKTIRF
jgi:hypothetical protein